MTGLEVWLSSDTGNVQILPFPHARTVPLMDQCHGSYHEDIPPG